MAPLNPFFMNKTRKFGIIIFLLIIGLVLAHEYIPHEFVHEYLEHGLSASAGESHPHDETITLNLKELSFYTNLSKAMEQAKIQNRHVFIYIHSESCLWCRKFEEESFTNKSAVELLDSRFVLLAIDADRQSNIAMGLGAPYNPTMIFVDKDGNEVKRIVGYVETGVFLEGIKEVVNHGQHHH